MVRSLCGRSAVILRSLIAASVRCASSLASGGTCRHLTVVTMPVAAVPPSRYKIKTNWPAHQRKGQTGEAETHAQRDPTVASHPCGLLRFEPHYRSASASNVPGHRFDLVRVGGGHTPRARASAAGTGLGGATGAT